MVRKENWPLLLSNYLAERRKMAFEWGVNDCLAFVAKGVERLTGETLYEAFSDYHDEESAKEMLALNGGVQGIISHYLGQGSRDVLYAKRGDVVTVRMPELTAGLVDDTGQRIALVSPEGLIRVPLKNAVKFWSY